MLSVAWSPDSMRLAYRHITSLRVVEIGGKDVPYDIAPPGTMITSFGWMDSDRLLVVAKRTGYRADMCGTPWRFEGYTQEAGDIRIMRVHRLSGVTNRFQQVVDHPTYMFHYFYFLDIASGKLADMTASLRPLWRKDLDTMNYLKDDWYRAGLPKAAGP